MNNTASGNVIRTAAAIMSPPVHDAGNGQRQHDEAKHLEAAGPVDEPGLFHYPRDRSPTPSWRHFATASGNWATSRVETSTSRSDTLTGTWTRCAPEPRS